MAQLFFFYGFAFLMAICSVMVIASRNPVTSAVFLVGDLFLMAGLFATLDAHFVAAIQILVYAGAIVVLFMFVIMLLNLSPDARDSLRIPIPEVGVLLLTIIGFVIIGIMLAVEQPTGVSGDMTSEAITTAGGNTYTVGMVLFTKYLWPFELSSILILLAVVASVVIAKKDKVEKPGAQAAKRRPIHGVR